MSTWTDIYDAHRRDVTHMGLDVLDVLRHWRDLCASKPDDGMLGEISEKAAATALMIVAEADNDPPTRIAQSVREEAVRLGRKADDALLGEWSRIRQTHDDKVLRTLVRDVRDTAARLDILLDDPSSPNSFADDLRKTLRRVADGDVRLDVPPGTNKPEKPPSKRGRPVDVTAALSAELIVDLYTAVTVSEPSITHGEPGPHSVQRFAADISPRLGLTVPGTRAMDVAIKTVQVEATIYINKHGSSASGATMKTKSEVMAEKTYLAVLKANLIEKARGDL